MKSFHILLLPVVSLQQHVGAMVLYKKGAHGNSVRSFRQILDNDEDLQYLGNMTVGGQLMQGIFDTGSIEFVVLSDKCAHWCGASAPLYHARRSSGYLHGNLSLVLSYGSGQLSALEAYDTVQIGPMKSDVTPFWEVMDAEMPLLLESSFETIVGLGPVPPDVSVMRPDHGVDNEGFAVLQKKMAIERFSVCLGQEALSPGYLTWNDPVLSTKRSLFTKVRIANTGYWMAELSDVKLGQFEACSNGCGAVVDSGTSLLAMPSRDYEKMEEIINAMANCGNIGSLPNLHFKLDGIPYTLPPDSYIGEVFGDVSGQVSKNFKLIKTVVNTSICQATLMEINMDSALGDVWILGVPFFRRFYSVFVQATKLEPAALYTAPANTECYPGTGKELLLGPGPPKSGSQFQRARRVDASKLGIGPWLQRAQASGRMEAKDHWKGRSVLASPAPRLHTMGKV